MKRIIPIAVTAILTSLIIISSCSKKNDNPVGNWTCHCSITAGGTTTTADIPMSNMAKNTAKTDCATAQSTYTSAGATTATCAIQ
jgi:hypothetical protein